MDAFLNKGLAVRQGRRHAERCAALAAGCLGRARDPRPPAKQQHPYARASTIAVPAADTMEVIDTHVHLNSSFSGGLPNEWVAGEGASFQKDWTEAELMEQAAACGVTIKSWVFVECFNRSPADEVKWVQSLVESPDSKCAAFVCQIYVQKGAAEVTAFLESIKGPDGSLPSGLRGARMVFPACGPEGNKPESVLDSTFYEGLAALESAGLHWEFVRPPLEQLPHHPCRQLVQTVHPAMLGRLCVPCSASTRSRHRICRKCAPSSPT
jgi:predicted TIM-barrel fold metal-dependent hydrolase